MGSNGVTEYLGEVVEVTLSGEGAGYARVLVDGSVRRARLIHTARSIRPGDTVSLTKPGAVWWVKAKATYTEPAQVGGSMGNKPPAANGSSISVDLPPDPPMEPSGNSNNQLYSWANNTSAYLARLSWWQSDVRSAIHRLRNAMNDLADRTNQVRDYAGRAGDLVSPIKDALTDEGIVR